MDFSFANWPFSKDWSVISKSP